MLFQVVKGMLGNITNTNVGMLPYRSFLGNGFTSKNFDHCGFTGTVGSNNTC